MRNFLIASLLICMIQVNGQSLIPYKDSINRFSIDIPEGWQYGINTNYPSIVLLALRTPPRPAEQSRDNFNINVLSTRSKDLDKTFADFVKYLPNGNKFKLIAKGDTSFNGMKVKWLIETHKNLNNNLQMHNYDFVALKEGKTYILTCVTLSSAFETVKPLFDKIASSFVLE
jgi:PsbP